MGANDWRFDINVFETFVSINAKNRITHNTINGQTVYNPTKYERMLGITMITKICRAIDLILLEIDEFDVNFRAAEYMMNIYRDLDIKVH